MNPKRLTKVHGVSGNEMSNTYTFPSRQVKKGKTLQFTCLELVSRL